MLTCILPCTDSIILAKLHLVLCAHHSTLVEALYMLQAGQCKHWHMPFFQKCEVRYRIAHQVMQKCSSILEGAATVTLDA